MFRAGNNVPTKMAITVANAKDAIEYWLNNAVLQGDVKIENISYSEKDHFTITIDRTVNKPDSMKE